VIEAEARIVRKMESKTMRICFLGVEERSKRCNVVVASRCVRKIVNWVGGRRRRRREEGRGREGEWKCQAEQSGST
jgi:hypothetical protein